MPDPHRCSSPVSLLGFIEDAVGLHADLDDVDEALDELARRLFADPCADALQALLGDDPGFRTDTESPDGLLLHRVLKRRAGHPLLLAAVLAEAGRRAGLPASVWSSPRGWYAGVRTPDGVSLVSTTGELAPPPERVRCHCAHEVAFAALLGLERRQPESGVAERARALRDALPVGDIHAAGDGSPEVFWP